MIRTFRRILAASLLAAAALCAAAPAAAEDVILHAFNWRYADVTARADEIARRGYRAVLVSPPLRSEGAPWYQRYQPQDYRVLHNPLGDREDLQAAINALRARGVAVHADVVLNHMANEASQRIDLDYPGVRVLGQYLLESAQQARRYLFGDVGSNLFTAADFHPARCIADYNDPAQVRNGRLCGGAGDPGLPDLASTPRVQAAQREYLSRLRELGITGFRVDAAKHMDNAHLNAVFTPAIRNGATVYGEIITGGGEGNGEYRLYLQPYLAETDHAAYDFPLFHAVRNAFSFGARLDALVDPAARGQALPGARAVTFTVTHDIPNNGIFRGLILDPVDETLAYAYVMGRAGGMPLVYSDNNESNDNNRWNGAWRRDDLTRMIGFRNAMRRQDMQVLSAGPCHLLFRRGLRGLVGINKCAEPVQAAIEVEAAGLPRFQRFRELLAGGSLMIESGPQTITLPPRAARMWQRGK
ncbi:MAG: alpha-amylase family protein [Xanthomonadaceae bacterium]|nr:alpha-amylase family protein [Xanthomonadaceae bacterium]